MHRGSCFLALCLASRFASSAAAQEHVWIVGPPPPSIAPWARPSDTGSHVGYPVGGGSASVHQADAPLPGEGTWGWDYQGHWFYRRVMLGWWHGRRYQGGIGAYPTDGPQVLHPIGPPEH